MFNPTKSKVKWYKRGGSYTKKINLKVDSRFANDEDVYVLSEDEFNQYVNPAMHDKNVELKEKLESITNDNFKLNDENKSLRNQLRTLENEFDALKLDNESIKQQIQSNDERILNEYKQKIEDAENKADKLQSEINQIHKDHKDEMHQQNQDHADEIKRLNQEIQDVNGKLFNVQLEMNDVQRFNAMLVQDANRKNLELRDYQDEVKTSIEKAVKETEKTAYDEIKKLGRIKLALHKNDIDLNIPIDNIIEDNTPAKRQGFFEVITTPQITNGDGDVEKNQEKNKE